MNDIYILYNSPNERVYTLKIKRMKHENGNTGLTTYDTWNDKFFSCLTLCRTEELNNDRLILVDNDDEQSYIETVLIENGIIYDKELKVKHIQYPVYELTEEAYNQLEFDDFIYQ